MSMNAPLAHARMSLNHIRANSRNDSYQIRTTSGQQPSH